MSRTQPAASPTSNFHWQLLFNNALKAYEKRTKNDLLVHPLAAQLQACDSPATILSLLHQQAQELDKSRNSDERLSKWLDPTVNVLHALSAALGEGVGLVFSPAKVIFAGAGLLLLAAKNFRASKDALVDIFERIEYFLRRLELYIQVPTTTEMKDIIVQIMVEVLCILGIATREIKETRTKKYMKKLFGRTDLEDALKRLDKLTHEEARMATAEILKATLTVDERVKGVAENVVGIDDRVTDVGERVVNIDNTVVNVENRVTDVDNRVAGVDNRVAIVDDKVAAVDNGVRVIDARVASVDGRLRAVDEKVAVVIDDGKEAKDVMQKAADDVDQVKQNQLRESIYKWLSPPDPSTNHNIACATHYKGTAAWFFQGSIFQEWKRRASLLWINGKRAPFHSFPDAVSCRIISIAGSGKSILCSTIIEDIAAMCKAGQASMAYLYFDFRNESKQHPHDLIPSLLIQLSALSEPRCDLLSHLYEAHDRGKIQPSGLILANFLKEMLALPDQRPIYLILDALDECPDTSGIPSPRERVLQLVKELVELRLPNLHICVTSRPEVDIRDVLEPLTSLRVSLHNESGQKQDILNYVKSIVYSDSERIMRRWKAEDKDLVIETLSERADGMFRWVFCQLEALRHCLPPSVRRTLKELPESLDETYERVLKEIKRPNRDHAHHVLQCLVVAARPLQVEELAEVLAVDFDDSEGIAMLKPSWRWEDEEQALLSSCSSLITIVHSGDSRVVQFSHFSVKEFLTSSRLLATSTQGVSRYHVALKPAHTIMGQACLSILLQSDDPIENAVLTSSPLAQYAAQHWVTHAQFEDVSTCLRTAMEDLFDLDKPYFHAWLALHDIDTLPVYGMPFSLFSPFGKSKADPLYYAALCGFYDLTEHLIANHPQQLNAYGGFQLRPLVAALGGKHFGVVELLLRNSADVSVNLRGAEDRTPLHSAVYYGHVDVAQFLLEHQADVHSRDSEGRTPLHNPSEGANRTKNSTILRRLVEVVRLLLRHGADINARADDGSTPLHSAVYFGIVEVARVLLEHGANVAAKDNNRKTAYEVASQMGQTKAMDLLSGWGAKGS
ncbi:hypothetical protein BC827DRAFT_548091 [Russula dissimulans]|nr:hypothetical protein BC827DRAFT_548091 [Russula dissimulans]